MIDSGGTAKIPLFSIVRTCIDLELNRETNAHAERN